MIRKLLVALGCVGIGPLVWHAHQTQVIQIQVFLSEDSSSSISISLRDKNRLTYLFYNILILDSGGYTIFGHKPIYINGGVKPFTVSCWSHFLRSISPHNIRMHLGWQTWLKYEHLFCDGPFTLKEEINPFSIDSKSSCLLLINKPSFNSTVQKHRLDFENVLQIGAVNGEQLLLEAKEKPLLKTILRSHDGLIGTLLGFGRNNAWLFEEKKSGAPSLLVPLWEEEIYDYLSKRPDGVYLEDFSLVLGYPTFLAELNTIETKELKNQFLRTRSQILDYYRGKDFLEATFQALLHPPDKHPPESREN